MPYARRSLRSVMRRVPGFVFLLVALFSWKSGAQIRGREGATADDFTFVQVCDPQLGMTDYRADICAFEQAVKQINLLRPAFVLICGDMVHKPNPRSLSDFLKIARQLTVPCHYVAGNHDLTLKTPGDMTSTYRSMFGKDYYAFSRGKTRFVVINTDAMRRPGRSDVDAQMAWVEEELAGAAKRGRVPVLVGHHPPFVDRPDEGPLYQNIPLAFRKRLLHLAKTYKVRGYLSGHLHRLLEQRWEGLHILSGEATSKSLDGRPRGFRLWQVRNGVPATHRFIPLYMREQIRPRPPYPPELETGGVASCCAHLRLLDAAKELVGMRGGRLNGAKLEPDTVWGTIPGGSNGLRCPVGGRYQLGVLGQDPVCTVAGHALPYTYQFE